MNRIAVFLLFYFILSLPLGAQQPNQPLHPWQGTGLIPDSILTLLDKQPCITKSSTDNLISIRPGWPVEIGIWQQYPVAADLTGDGLLELVIADISGNLHVFDNNGNYINAEWPKTLGVGMSSPAIADMDGDGRKEIIVVEGTNLYAAYWPKAQVYVLNTEAQVLSGWPVMLDGPHEHINSVSICDINNDKFLNVITATGSSCGFSPDSIVFYHKLYAFRNDGSLLPGWPVEPDSWSGYNRQPRSPLVIVDLDRDGYKDIISGFFSRESDFSILNPLYALDRFGNTLPGYFPVETDEINYAVASADMNGDGEYEIFSHGRKWRSNGFNDMEWRRPMWVISMLCFADVNQDGLPELIYGNYGYRAGVNVVDKDGRSLPGWPVNISGEHADVVDGNPVAGDIDGDGDVEILIGTYGKTNIYAFHHDGSPVEGFPISTGGCNSRIAIFDLDNDGDIELISACEDGWVYVWDIPSQGPCTNLEWPMYQHDERHTGVYPSSYNDVKDNEVTDQPADFELFQNIPILSTMKPESLIYCPPGRISHCPLLTCGGEP
ncbi:VCBS repeat-containing protein [bacterium]|nr:VCBS repeat-containing protein [bacterium]